MNLINLNFYFELYNQSHYIQYKLSTIVLSILS
jgi:hypothetical protein